MVLPPPGCPFFISIMGRKIMQKAIQIVRSDEDQRSFSLQILQKQKQENCKKREDQENILQGRQKRRPYIRQEMWN